MNGHSHKANSSQETNNETILTKNTKTKSFPQIRTPPAPSSNNADNNPPASTMQVHSKPSSGRRQSRAKSQGPAKPFSYNDSTTITAITPERRSLINKTKTIAQENNKQKETMIPTENHKNKTQKNAALTMNIDPNHQQHEEVENHDDTEANPDTGMQQDNDNNHAQEHNGASHENKNGSEPGLHDNQGDPNGQAHNDDPNDADPANNETEEEEMNDDAQTNTAASPSNPYRTLRQPQKRAPSPEPAMLIHLHVMVNHNPNPQAESALPRLTEQAVKDHLNQVFFHHSKREEPMWLQVHKVEFIETKQAGRPSFRQNDQQRQRNNNGHVSSFHVTLSPAPANDAFDTEVFREQGLRCVLQMWHRHKNDDFSHDDFGDPSILRNGTPQSNPTTNPRWDQYNVYLPANNNRTSDTFGMVVGIPAQAIKHRRAAQDLTAAIQHSLRAHLPRKLDWTAFFDHIGCRSGTFSGELKSKQRGQVPVVYITASSRANFELLLRSYNAFTAANRDTDITWQDNKIQLIPMPKTQTNRTTTLETIKDIDQFFGSSVKIRLRPINTEATDGDWKQLKTMDEYIAVFPEYDNEDPDPIYYTLIMRKTPDTHHLTTNTIRTHPGFPTNILLPTLAAVAATPPRQPSTNQDTPTSSTHTNRLIAFADRLLRRKTNSAEDHNHQPTTSTRARNTPPGTPPPTKRTATHFSDDGNDDDEDPYNDGTDWTQVATNMDHSHQYNRLAHKPAQNDDRKPPAQQNSFSALAEDEHSHNNKRHHDEDDVDRMETEEDNDDAHSQSLIPPDDLDDNEAHPQYSAPTGHEIALIMQYVRNNKPSRTAEMRKYLQQTKSFANDTDAEDAWRYAQSLVQTSSSSVAGSRTGHVVPHATWAKEQNE